MSIFLSRLKELLQESGKQQKDICADLGIRTQKLSNWKTGYSEPNFDDLVMLANYFEVSTDYLLGNGENLGGTLKTATTALLKEEKSLLNDFRTLSKVEQVQVKEYVSFLAEKHKQ